MKGIITKDLCLMMQRKRSFLLLMACGLCLCLSMSPSAIIIWITLIGSLFALSTIAYDEYDNSYPFLMTLPYTRREYALSCYLFGLICILFFTLFGVVMQIVAATVHGNPLFTLDDLFNFVLVVLLPLLILDVSIPINLKFGTERGRIINVIVVGIVAVIVFWFISFWKPEDAGLSRLAVSGGILTLIIAGITAVATVVSIGVSIRIMEKKEF